MRNGFLSRKLGEKIVIGTTTSSSLVVKIVDRNQIRIGIEAFSEKDIGAIARKSLSRSA